VLDSGKSPQVTASLVANIYSPVTGASQQLPVEDKAIKMLNRRIKFCRGKK